MPKHRKIDTRPSKDNRARGVAVAALLAGGAAVAVPAIAPALVTAAPSTTQLPERSADPSSAAPKAEAFAFFGWSSIFDASWDPHWGPHNRKYHGPLA